MIETEMTVDRFLSEVDCLVAVGVKSRTTLRRMIERNDFPAPVRLSPNRIGWSLIEVAQWQAERLAQRDAR